MKKEFCGNCRFVGKEETDYIMMVLLDFAVVIRRLLWL